MKSKRLLLCLVVMFVSLFVCGQLAFASGTYTISGKVTSGTSAVAGATVNLLLEDGSSTIVKTTTTNSSGNYTLSGVSSNDYLLRVAKSGYKNTVKDVEVGSANLVQNIPLYSSSIATNTLALTVVSRDTGVVQSGVAVSLKNQSTNTVVSSGSTDSSGIFRGNNIPNGTYAITLSKTGYVTRIEPGKLINENIITTATLRPGTYASLVGKVATSAGTGISGVTVTATPIIGGTAVSTVSDASGNYSLNTLIQTNYNVVFSKTGYGTVTGNNVSVSSVTTKNITMTPTVTGYTISGKVTNNGSAIAGVTITLGNDDTGSVMRTVTTDASGNYAITGLANGNYFMESAKSGYKNTGVYDIKINGANLVQNIPLYSSTISTNNLYATIVNRSTGAVLAGVNMSMRNKTTGVVVKTGISDVNGVFSASGIPNGDYLVTLSKTGYITQIVSDASINENIIVKIRMTPGTAASLGGKVATSTGAGIAGATISATPVIGGTAVMATSDASGNYTVNSLVDTQYNVVVTKTGYGTVRANNVSVRGATTKNITMTPTVITGYSISGKVTSNGAAIAGVTITLGSDTNSLVRTVTTDASGNYAINGLANGNYFIESAKSGYKNTGVSDIKINGANLVQNIPLYSSTISGNTVFTTIVNRSTGAALSGVNMSMKNKTTGVVVRTGTSNISGAWSSTGIPNGDYFITFIKTGYITRLITDATINENIIATIRMTPGTTASMGGKITTSTGAAIAGATITATPVAGGTAVTAVSDASGNYTVNSLIDTEYNVVVAKSGYTNKVVNDVSIRGTTTKNITMTSTVAGYSISGKVTNNGTAVAGVTITLGNDDTGSVVRTVTTDASGNYAITGVSNGNYFIESAKSGYKNTGVYDIKINGANLVQNIPLYSSTISGNTVYATIINHSTGAVLSGVNLSVRNKTTGVVVGTGSSNVNGVFSASGIPTGNYVITLSKAGYITRITSDASINENIIVTIRMTPGTVASLGGKVTTSTGTAISGATISATPVIGGTAVNAISDASGNYTVNSLVDAEYNVVVTKTGYGTITANNISIRGATTKNITMASTVAGVESAGN